MPGNLGQGLAAKAETAAFILEIDKVTGVFKEGDKIAIQFANFFVRLLACSNSSLYTGEIEASSQNRVPSFLRL